MKPEIERAIESTEKMIVDQIAQLGTDLIFTNIYDKCSFCPSDATGAILQTIPLKNWTIGMAFSVCDNCGKQENSATIFNDFIKDMFALSRPPVTDILSTNELRQAAIEALTKDCHLRDITDNDKDGGFEIIGTRKSGLTIIFRFKNMNDYAYVFILNGIEKCRIDTAAHHLKSISYGPDHLHDIQQNTVKASPTFGAPTIDTHFVKKIIDKIESEHHFVG